MKVISEDPTTFTGGRKHSQGFLHRFNPSCSVERENGDKNSPSALVTPQDRRTVPKGIRRKPGQTGGFLRVFRSC